jgi:hypothetical protein
VKMKGAWDRFGRWGRLRGLNSRPSVYKAECQSLPTENIKFVPIERVLPATSVLLGLYSMVSVKRDQIGGHCSLASIERNFLHPGVYSKLGMFGCERSGHVAPTR